MLWHYYWFDGASPTGVTSGYDIAGSHARPHPPTPSPSWRGGANGEKLDRKGDMSALENAHVLSLLRIAPPRQDGEGVGG